MGPTRGTATAAAGWRQLHTRTPIAPRHTPTSTGIALTDCLRSQPAGKNTYCIFGESGFEGRGYRFTMKDSSIEIDDSSTEKDDSSTEK